MNTTLTVDKSGRIVIPKFVPDRLCLNEGMELTLELFGHRIELRPKAETACIAKIGKLRVIPGGEAFHGGAAILADREQRLARVAPRGRKHNR